MSLLNHQLRKCSLITHVSAFVDEWNIKYPTNTPLNLIKIASIIEKNGINEFNFEDKSQKGTFGKLLKLEGGYPASAANALWEYIYKVKNLKFVLQTEYFFDYITVSDYQQQYSHQETQIQQLKTEKKRCDVLQ
eukprot:989188_1